MDKGQRVLIQGKLMYGEITDAQGIQRTTTTIVADDVVFLTKANPAYDSNQLLDADKRANAGEDL
jgi:single-stranded DNA-binding protein